MGSASIAYETTDMDCQGGLLGFLPAVSQTASVDDLTITLDTDADGDFGDEVPEHIEAFTLDGTPGGGYANETLEHDAAGNLTYDGMYAYAYDAWNRLVQVTKAYRDPGSPGTPTLGSVIATIRYDGTPGGGRRIEKAITNSADLDATYHYYLHGQSVVELRSGSDAVLKQYVWNTASGGYIDELVHIAINGDPVDDPLFDPDDADHDPRTYFAFHNANYNVIAIVDATSGGIAERYEYTPYGQRIVFRAGGNGSTDPLHHASSFLSQRVELADTSLAPYGICEVGHQGLFHEEEIEGLIYNRARHLHTVTGRFMQRDPLGYADGMTSYVYYAGLGGDIDPTGLATLTLWEKCKCVLKCGYLKCSDAKTLGEEALLETEQLYPTSLHNGPGDAWRHCVWSCRMARVIGQTCAKYAGDLNEDAGDRVGQPPNERVMDEHNNWIGRALAATAGDCGTLCTKVLNDGSLMTIQPPNTPTPIQIGPPVPYNPAPDDPPPTVVLPPSPPSPPNPYGPS